MGYLTNAIKALFTRNTTNAASVSGARVPIVEQNGNPIGNDSMANLAAVLGAVKRGGTLTSSNDLNNIKETGAWTVADPAGVPNSPYTYGILLCFSTGGNYPYAQIIFGTAGGQLMFRRGFNNGTWSDWFLG